MFEDASGSRQLSPASGRTIFLSWVKTLSVRARAGLGEHAGWGRSPGGGNWKPHYPECCARRGREDARRGWARRGRAQGARPSGARAGPGGAVRGCRNPGSAASLARPGTGKGAGVGNRAGGNQLRTEVAGLSPPAPTPSFPQCGAVRSCGNPPSPQPPSPNRSAAGNAPVAENSRVLRRNQTPLPGGV